MPFDDRPMIWARMTPVSMAPASTIGRQACLASSPQATVNTRMMIGRPMGPKTMARMIMMVVAGSPRSATSPERTGSSTALMPPCCSTLTRMKVNATTPTTISTTAIR